MSLKKKLNDAFDTVKDITDETILKTQNKVVSAKNSIVETYDELKQLPDDIKYIKAKNTEIEEILAETNQIIEPVREELNSDLEKLGEIKIELFETIFAEFNQHLTEIKNIPLISEVKASHEDTAIDFSLKDMQDLGVSIVSLKSIVKNSLGAGATGVASAGAIYSAVAAFGAASTGTAIGTLSGAAATNATLAWLGGGALAIGGGGIALGTLVLGGIAIVPAVSYLIWKGKFNYAKEKEAVEKSYHEVVQYAKDMEKIADNFQEISRLINNIIALINRYKVECNKLNKQTTHIIKQIGKNYQTYTAEQQQLIQKNINYISKLLKLVNTPIMLENGSLNRDILTVLQEANEFITTAEPIRFKDYKKRGFLASLIAIFTRG